jgi:hypothetical protein
MEAIEVIQIIDELKIIYQADRMQDRLNVWKSLVIYMDTNGEWNSKDFEIELDAESAIIKSILTRIKK